MFGLLKYIFWLKKQQQKTGHTSVDIAAADFLKSIHWVTEDY